MALGREGGEDVRGRTRPGCEGTVQNDQWDKYPQERTSQPSATIKGLSLIPRRRYLDWSPLRKRSSSRKRGVHSVGNSTRFYGRLRVNLSAFHPVSSRSPCDYSVNCTTTSSIPSLPSRDPFRDIVQFMPDHSTSTLLHVASHASLHTLCYLPLHRKLYHHAHLGLTPRWSACQRLSRSHID